MHLNHLMYLFLTGKLKQAMATAAMAGRTRASPVKCLTWPNRQSGRTLSISPAALRYLSVHLRPAPTRAYRTRCALPRPSKYVRTGNPAMSLLDVASALTDVVLRWFEQGLPCS